MVKINSITEVIFIFFFIHLAYLQHKFCSTLIAVDFLQIFTQLRNRVVIEGTFFQYNNSATMATMHTYVTISFVYTATDSEISLSKY